MPPSLLDLIPLEIVHHIISYIPSWQKCDLHSCALTCRTLVQPVQMKLFSRIGIWKVQHARNLLSILTTSPYLGTYVNHLEMNSSGVCKATVDLCPKLLGHMTSLKKLGMRDFFGQEPWEAARDAFMLILPKVESLGLMYMREVPLWVVSSCRQLQFLYVYDGYFVVDPLDSTGRIESLQPLPLQSLSIAGIMNEDKETISPLFELLVLSAKTVVSLDTPTDIGPYGGKGDRWDWPLGRAPELLNPMRNTLVTLTLDHWEALYVDRWSPCEHPFSIARYPHLREFSIRFEPNIDEDEPESVSDEEAFSQFASEIAWLAQTLEVISTPHPLSQIRLEIECWTVLNPGHPLISVAWKRLDRVLQRRKVLPNFKAFLVSRHYSKGPACVVKQLLLETDKRGVLVLDGCNDAI
ncbi:hypothetical protein DL96DRAFT_218715 [Flagelloscypha sp. PMI_526]|nr:hypothetical protein DL96DRAFT_218715 [Flagelloscypha sp. PMI_526]